MAVKSSKNILFSYRPGLSVFHRLPAWLKITAMFILQSIAFLLPLHICLLLIAITVLAAFSAGFCIKEQLQDLKPCIYYALLLWTTGILTEISIQGTDTAFTKNLFYPMPADIVLCIRLVLALQFASLFFHTTSSLALRQGLAAIETTIRSILPVSKVPAFTEIFSFFLMFIPMVFNIWDKIDFAWKARGGKNSIRRISILIPVLISLSAYEVCQISKAIRNRQYRKQAG